MRRTFHFQIHRGFQPGKLTNTRQIHRFILRDDFKLDALFQAIARHIRLHRRRHVINRRFNFKLGGRFAQHIHRVAHHQRRLSRVKYDNGFAFSRAPHHFNRLRGGFGKLVDIGAGARSRRFTGDRGDNFGVMDFCHARNRRHHRDGRLPAAGHHIDVLLVNVGLQIHHRDAVRADRCGRQVDQTDPRFYGAQRGVIFHVRARAGGIKHDVDVGEFWHRKKPRHPFMGGGNAHTPGACQTVGLRINPHHHRHLQTYAVTQNFNHQIGADVARADNGDFTLTHD